MPANLYSDLADVQKPVAAADTWSRQPGLESTGVLLHREAVYTLTAGTDEASGDLLYICKIPANTRIRPDLCKIVCNDPGTAFNIATIGITKVNTAGSATNDLDSLSTAIDISAGGAFDLAYAAQVDGLVGITTTEDMWLVATLGTVTSPTVSYTHLTLPTK
jgi:hypothetical protein